MTHKAEQLIARQETFAKFPFLIKIIHEQFGTFRFANSDEDITYNGEVYQAAYFTIEPPSKEGGKIGDGQISISTVDQIIIEKIRNTQIAASIIFIATIAYNDGMIAGIEPIEEMELTLRAIDWSEDVMTGQLIFDESMGIIIPCDRATTLKCPGVA
jgi:hypothetical protein